MKVDSFDLVLDQLSIGLIVTDEDLNVYYWNRWLEIQTGIHKDEILNKKLTDFFDNIEIPILKRKIKTSIKINAATYYEPINKTYFLPIPLDRLTNTDMQYMVQKSTITPYKESLVTIAIYDQTDVKAVQNRLNLEMEKVNSLNTELSHNQKIIDKNLMYLKTDLDGTIKECSEALLKYYKYEKDEIIGQNPSILRHPDSPTALFKELWDTLKEKKNWKGEVKNIDKNGETHWVDSVILPFLDKDGEVVDYTAIYHDINDKKRIEELSIKDHLTSLYNRRYFDEIYKKELNKHRKNRDLSSSFRYRLL